MICSKCKLEHKLRHFYKGQTAEDGLFRTCRSCKEKSWKNALNRQKIYYYENREQILIKQSKRDKNRTKDPLNAVQKAAVSSRQNKRNKHFKKKDPRFKLIYNIRNRIYSVFKGKSKSKTSKELLGAPLDTVKIYIESLFYSDKNSQTMSWGNYGNGPMKWQIDHIVPLGLAKNKEEIEKLCHYSNLQPLWHIDHSRKTVEDIRNIKDSKINDLDEDNYV